MKLRKLPTPLSKLAATCCRISPVDGLGAATVITEGAVLVTEPLVAVMLAVPSATGVTRPFASTVATAVLSEAQVKSVETVAPFWSRVSALNC